MPNSPYPSAPLDDRCQVENLVAPISLASLALCLAGTSSATAAEAPAAGPLSSDGSGPTAASRHRSHLDWTAAAPTDISPLDLANSITVRSAPQLSAAQPTTCGTDCSDAAPFAFDPAPTFSRQASPWANAPTTAAPQENYLQQILASRSQTASQDSWAQAPAAADSPEIAPAQPRRGLAGPSFNLQAVGIAGDDDASGRLRLTGSYPISRNLLIGGSVEAVTGNDFVDSQEEGLRLNELYLAASLPSAPNLRLVAGQLDLSSYFDRNSFAKDGATQFFNPAFQSSPALIAALGDSTPAALLNWSVNDSLDVRAAAFSSDNDISDFNIDSYAGEVAYRFGNAAIRGTYVSARDGGANTGFQESFLIDRGNDRTGVLSGDREVAYGINGEVYIPEANIGLFARYGIYENQTLDLSGDSFSVGVTAFDVLSQNDRLGLAYGQQLSNDDLRDQENLDSADVVELFYDFEPAPNLRVGASAQYAGDDTRFKLRVGYDVDLGLGF